MNNSILDGADNNQAFFSEERGRKRIAYSISSSAVQEFQINASNYSSEYGRAAGGVVNTVTRSGGNALHGQAFYFDRSSNWAARNPFTILTTKDAFGIYQTAPYKPHETRYQGGVSAGGPIRKDKLFWFFSWDENYRDFPGVARAQHPEKFFALPSTDAPADARCAHSHHDGPGEGETTAPLSTSWRRSWGWWIARQTSPFSFPKSTGRSATATI